MAAAMLTVAGVIAAGCTSGPSTGGGTEGASDYPTRNIEIMVAFEGGTSDTVARMLAQYASAEWGVNVDVVNKAGGNTVPANLELQGDEPDGYSLMFHAIGSSSLLPNQLGDDLPFDVMNQTFISRLSSNTMLFLTSPDSPFETLQDAADAAKADPEHFTWSATGVAEIPMLQFFRSIGVDPQKTKSLIQDGSGDAIVLANQGDADLVIAAVGPSLGPVEGNVVKPLAIADDRWPGLDVPTTTEAGFPEVQITSWLGLAGPKGLPDDVVSAWEELIEKMLDEPDIQEQLENVASRPAFMNSKDFTAHVQSEIEEFGSLYED
ncbi:tripartite tricarboxylate transporter substrate binding protein [Microbacterium soli]|uniref:Tripartite tricarboxylate transporter substrate binding protein n=2 Tax=Microbacterium soli TaxID=446075 RepID=A0ABP7NCM5_9MICO